MSVIVTLLLAQVQLVQTDGITFQSAITLSSPVTRGNLLVAVPNWLDASHAELTLTDSMGNRWQQVATRVDGAGGLSDLNATVFVTEAVASGTLTVTPGTGTYNLVLFEFQGAPPLPLVTVDASSQSANASDTDTSPVVVPDGGFALAWVLVSGGVGTTPPSLTELSRYDGDFYAITTSPGPLRVQLACSGAWMAQAVTFAAAEPDAGSPSDDAGVQQQGTRRLAVATGCTTSPDDSWLVLSLALLSGVSRLRRVPWRSVPMSRS